jgi:hypothetical protein
VPAVLEYYRQHQWNAETAALALQSVVKKSWFGQALLRRLQFRAMNEDEAIAALAAECAAGPTAKPQLRMLIDYCEAAGILARANGQLTAAVVSETPPSLESLEHLVVPAREENSAPTQAAAPPARPASGDGGVNFSVAVDVSMAEMKDWSAERIAAFFAGIAQVLAAKNG